MCHELEAGQDDKIYEPNRGVDFFFRADSDVLLYEKARRYRRKPRRKTTKLCKKRLRKTNIKSMKRLRLLKQQLKVAERLPCPLPVRPICPYLPLPPPPPPPPFPDLKKKTTQGRQERPRSHNPRRKNYNQEESRLVERFVKTARPAFQEDRQRKLATARLSFLSAKAIMSLRKKWHFPHA